jgi:hypothetical protein
VSDPSNIIVYPLISQIASISHNFAFPASTASLVPFWLLLLAVGSFRLLFEVIDVLLSLQLLIFTLFLSLELLDPLLLFVHCDFCLSQLGHFFSIVRFHFEDHRR